MVKFHHPAFEYVVREELNNKDRPITEQDLLKVNILECCDFDFETEDIETLKCCRNLKKLDFNIYTEAVDFLDYFPLLEELYIETYGRKNCVDFHIFSNLSNLKKLWVSGGGFSSMDLLHLDALTPLNNLRLLCLHEFGKVDLLFLKEIPWLEEFECRYGNEVANIESIKELKNLSFLCLDGLEMNDLDFLDDLPNSMTLEMCGNEVRNGIDVSKLRRFAKVSIEEMTVGHHPVSISI